MRSKKISLDNDFIMSLRLPKKEYVKLTVLCLKLNKTKSELIRMMIESYTYNMEDPEN